MTKDAAGIEAESFDKAPILYEHVAAVSAGTTVTALADKYSAAAAPGAATTTDALREDTVRTQTFRNDFRTEQVPDLDIATQASTATVTAGRVKNADALAAAATEAANALDRKSVV